jgi:arsenite oxidase small subunit
MRRREFVRLCGAAAAAAAASPALSADASPHLYARVKLVDADGAPLRASAVPRDRNLIFAYPYVTTPCFLLNLGRPLTATVRLQTEAQHSYEWQGGVGPARSLVAYSAICAHRMAYPTRQITFISYRAKATPQDPLAHVIHCCSEQSQYDPAAGARVLAGPAPQPLAAILLEYDDRRDELYALGTLGGEMFNRFFAKYAFRLGLDYGRGAERLVSGVVRVVPLEDYSRQQVVC